MQRNYAPTFPPNSMSQVPLFTVLQVLTVQQKTKQTGPYSKLKNRHLKKMSIQNKSFRKFRQIVCVTEIKFLARVSVTGDQQSRGKYKVRFCSEDPSNSNIESKQITLQETTKPLHVNYSFFARLNFQFILLKS